MTGRQLAVLLHGARAGIVTEDDRGRFTLIYDDAWRQTPGALPVSLSMPLAGRAHPDPVVRAFLWGLLPDSERVLERWGRTYQVSAGNPFALLRHVGEDCAGAVQLAAPERVDALLADEGGVDWIDEHEIADRLRNLRRDPTAWQMARTGQFSLAGAQAKTALHHDPVSGRWGDAWGAVPSTHILKPAITGFDDHDLNEHLCLETARRAGLPGARSAVTTFGDERAIVVERYDRVRRGRRTDRVHQEDACQAFGVLPSVKYQNEGGPSPEAIIGLLRREVRPGPVADADVGRFVDALAFNWIIAGTDAHAKNYSILVAPVQVRFAPLYDLASVLPYDDMYLPKLRMAMRIGGEYRIAALTGRHWRRFAVDNGLDPEPLMARISELAERVPDAFAAAAKDPAVQALGSDLPERLVERVTEHARRCRAALGRD